MKKLIFIGSLALLTTFSCKKDKPDDPDPVPTRYEISSNDVGTVGLYRMGVDTTDLSVFSLGTPGEGKTWNFAQLDTNDTDTIKFLDTAGTPASASFTTSNLVMTDASEEAYSYINKSSSKAEVEGIYMSNSMITGAFPYSDKMIVMQFPMYFGTSFNDPYSLTFTSQAGSYWVKVEMTGSTSSSVDATGKVTIPAGLFDCIREKRTEIQSQKVYTGLTQSGPWTIVQQNNDTTYTYIYFTKGKGFSICEVDVNNFTDTIITIKSISHLLAQ